MKNLALTTLINVEVDKTFHQNVWKFQNLSRVLLTNF